MTAKVSTVYEHSFRRLTDQILIINRVPLTLSEVVEENLEVGVEREFPRSICWDETEHLHRTVGADVKVPVESGEVDGGNLAADWVNAANARKPKCVSGRRYRLELKQTHQTINS